MAKLFIVGIPRDMDEVELVELFSVHGMVNTVTIITDRETGESKGYSFVAMADPAGAERAIAALDQGEIDGRTISVRFSEDRVGVAGRPSQPVQTSHNSAAAQPPQQKPRSKRPRLPKH